MGTNLLLACLLASFALASSHPTSLQTGAGGLRVVTRHDVLEGGARPLRLCECEPATGPPFGLSCEKEGFFISNFEREGQWLAGGGMVPLSRAVCCRPCLPDPDDQEVAGMLAEFSDDVNATALAVVSIGCHKSDAPGEVVGTHDSAQGCGGNATDIRQQLLSLRLFWYQDGAFSILRHAPG